MGKWLSGLSTQQKIGSIGGRRVLAGDDVHDLPEISWAKGNGRIAGFSDHVPVLLRANSAVDHSGERGAMGRLTPMPVRTRGPANIKRAMRIRCATVASVSMVSSSQ